MERLLHAPALNILLTFCAVALCTGCAGPRSARPVDTGRIESKIASLQAGLMSLGTTTDPDEARRVAQTAVTDSLRLADTYRVTTPARWHNLLIQMGFRDRGLCFHWTEDLLQRLQALELKTYQLHWAVAYKGSDLREHNSVVITAWNEPFETGLVLDPWRNSGDLYWTAVRRDSYPWMPLPPDQW